MNMLDWAHRHASTFAILPFETRRKKPCIKSGKQHGNATQDPAKFVPWFTQFSEPNIAAVPGMTGFLVIDVDRGHANGVDGAAQFQILRQQFKLPRTVTVATPSGGWHYWYRLPADVTFQSWTPFPGVELKSHAVCVLLPPSIGKDGTEYEYAVPPDYIGYAEIPRAFIEAFTKPTTTRQPRDPREQDREDYGLLPGTPADTTGSAKGLVQLLSYDACIPPLCRLLGIPNVGLGVAFRCVLPGHSEIEPSSTLVRHRDGHVHYKEWHKKTAGIEWLELAEVYHAQMTGNVVRLPQTELARWTAKLVVDAGIVTPTLMLPPFPPEAKPNEKHQRVYDLYEYCMGFRSLIGDTAMPFAQHFIAANCELKPRTANNIRRNLVEWQIIEPAGEWKEPESRRKCVLYAPCGDARSGDGLAVVSL